MKTIEELSLAWTTIVFDESELPLHEKTSLSDLATHKAMASLGFHAGYKSRDKEVEQLKIQIADLKAEIKEEWLEEVAELNKEIKYLKEELRDANSRD